MPDWPRHSVENSFNFKTLSVVGWRCFCFALKQRSKLSLFTGLWKIMNSDHTALGLNYLGEKSIKKLGRTEINPGFPSTQSELETASPKSKGYVPCALSPDLKKLILLLTGEHLPLIPQPLPVSPRHSRAPHASPQRPTQSRHPVTTAQQLQATSTRRYEQENGVTCGAPALASNPWPTVIPRAIPAARGGEAPGDPQPLPRDAAPGPP